MIFSIIAKYLIRNISIMFLAILLIISFIILSNAFASILNSSQNLEIGNIILLVLIKFSKELPLIIILSVALSVVISVNKLYKDSEISAINNAGIGDIGLFKSILPLVIIITTIIALLSLVISPNLLKLESNIINQSINTNNLNFIQNKKFQLVDNGNIVIYAKNNQKNLTDAFIYNKLDDSIILASEIKLITDIDNNIYADILRGISYGNISQDSNTILEFAKSRAKIKDTLKNIDKTKVKTTTELLFSNNPQDLAELGFRISLPISVIILIFISILLARTKPRATKNFVVLYTLLITVFYIYVLKLMKKMVENSEVFWLIGNNITHLIFIIITIFLFYWTNNKART